MSTLAFSPDGRYLASAGGQLTVYPHASVSLTCFLSLSLSTGEDLAINLWDLGSGKRIKKMTGHTASVYSLAFSAESSMLVSGAADWTVRCWDVKGAGGLPTKSKENGVNGVVTNGAGDSTSDNSTKGHESNIETYVTYNSACARH